MQKLVLCLLVVCFFSCTDESSETSEMYFELNSKLVDEETIDTTLKVSYRTPSVWKDMTADTSIQSKMKAINLKSIEVRKILSSADGSSLFALLDISKVPTENFQQLKVNYSKELNTQGQWSAIKLDSFTKDGFNISQFVMANKNATQFELLFFRNTRPKLALNFFTLIDSGYQAKTKIFESIIASIKPF